MPLPGIDPATFVVPENQLLVYKSGEAFYGKKSTSAIVDVDTDDMIRMDLTAADLPCLVPEAVYTEAHAQPAIQNLDKSSAFTKTAAYKFGKLVQDQKASRAELSTNVYQLDQKIQETGGSVTAEKERAMAAEAGLQTNIDNLDASITFHKLIDRVWIYGNNVFDLNYMVNTGVFYCSTNASVVGQSMTNMPAGTSEGLLFVAKNSQVFIEGGTAKGRMYYRYQTGAGSEVTAYTEAWTSGAMLKDVTDLDAEIKAIIGTLPTGKTVAQAIEDVGTLLAGLRTAVEATAGADAIVVTAGSDAATKNISLLLNGTTMSQSAAGLKCELTMKKQASAEEGFAATYFLTDSTGMNVIGDKINLIKDQFLKSATIYVATGDTPPADWAGDTYIKGHKYIKFVWETKSSTETGSETVFYLDVESIIDTYTGKEAIVVDQTKNEISLKIDSASETLTTSAGSGQAVLTQGDSGVKVGNIQGAIDFAVANEKTRAEGAESTLTTNLNTEISDRQTAITTEATARANEDTAIRNDMTAGLATKTTTTLTDASGNKSLVFNEQDGGGVKYESASDNRWNFIGVNNGEAGIEGMMYSLIENAEGKRQGVRFTMFNDKITYVPNGVLTDGTAADREITVKADVATAKAEAIQAAEDKDAARYATVTSDIAAVKSELQANIDAEAATRQAQDALKTTTLLTDESGNKSYIFNKLDGGGAKIERSATSGVKNVFVGVNLSDGDRAENHALASIYALDADSVGTRFTVFNDMITYKANASEADRNLSAYELAVKDDVATAKSEALALSVLLDGSQPMTGDLIVRQVGGQAPGSTALVVIGGTPNAETATSSTVDFKIKYGMGTEVVSALTPDGSVVLTQNLGDARYLFKVATEKAAEIIIAKADGDVEVSGYKLGGDTISSEEATRQITVASEQAVFNVKSDLLNGLNTHAALDSRHTAPVEFVRTAGAKTLEYKRYIVKVALTGTLPSGDLADGKEIIVKIISGGEGTIIKAGEGDVIDDGSAAGASEVALNISNASFDFIYDATDKKWYIL